MWNVEKGAWKIVPGELYIALATWDVKYGT